MRSPHLNALLAATRQVGGGAFTDDDERLMRMLCDHIAVFVDHVHGLSE